VFFSGDEQVCCQNQPGLWSHSPLLPLALLYCGIWAIRTKQGLCGTFYAAGIREANVYQSGGDVIFRSYLSVRRVFLESINASTSVIDLLSMSDRGTVAALL
jgi:hypothetical protein